MKAIHTITLQLLVAATLAALAPVGSAAPRELLEFRDAELRTDGKLRCNQNAEATISARDPLLLLLVTSQSERMQSLSDATQALSGVGCRNFCSLVTQQVILRDGTTETNELTACRQPDGTWLALGTQRIQ